VVAKQRGKIDTGDVRSAPVARDGLEWTLR
jgi:hypothetical protein